MLAIASTEVISFKSSKGTPKILGDNFSDFTISCFCSSEKMSITTEAILVKESFYRSGGCLKLFLNLMLNRILSNAVLNTKYVLRELLYTLIYLRPLSFQF